MTDNEDGKQGSESTPLIHDRYEIIRVVAVGGQAELVLARDQQHDRFVALKIYSAGASDSLTTLLHEARLLLTLRPHPNLPVVRDDFFLDDGRYVIVMDWIEGTNLRDLVVSEGSPGLPFSDSLRYLEAIADALEHLHAHEPPIIHQDVKPANVIRSEDGRVVLVDFGIASWQQRDASPGGSPGYTSPELISGDKPTVASDVYGLAASAAFLLTGALPELGSKPNLTSFTVRKARRIRRALSHGLSLDPARREQSARRLVRSVRPVAYRAIHPITIFGRIVAATAALLLVAALAIFGSLGYVLTRASRADDVLSEQKRVEQLAAGYDISAFRNALGQPEIERRIGSLDENYFVRDFEWVQTIADQSGEVLFFAVTSRKANFAPRFRLNCYSGSQRTIVLGRSTFIDQHESANALLLGEPTMGGFIYGEAVGGDHCNNWQTTIVASSPFGYRSGPRLKGDMNVYSTLEPVFYSLECPGSECSDDAMLSVGWFGSRVDANPSALSKTLAKVGQIRSKLTINTWGMTSPDAFTDNPELADALLSTGLGPDEILARQSR